MDEKQAIAFLKQGNKQGLEPLVHIYQLQAIRAAALITGDCELSEDIVQSAFIRAADRIEQYDSQRVLREGLDIRVSFGSKMLIAAFQKGKMTGDS